MPFTLSTCLSKNFSGGSSCMTSPVGTEGGNTSGLTFFIVAVRLAFGIELSFCKDKLRSEEGYLSNALSHQQGMIIKSIPFALANSRFTLSRFLYTDVGSYE